MFAMYDKYVLSIWHEKLEVEWSLILHVYEYTVVEESKLSIA